MRSTLVVGIINSNMLWERLSFTLINITLKPRNVKEQTKVTSKIWDNHKTYSKNNVLNK